MGKEMRTNLLQGWSPELLPKRKGQGPACRALVGFRSSAGNCEYPNEAWERAGQLMTLGVRLAEA